MPTTVSGSYPAVNSDSDATINGLTVGRGAGAISTNTAVGASALNANTTGVQSVAFGTNALILNTTGVNNSALGAYTLIANTTGGRNTAVGYATLFANTTGSFNTAIGQSALEANTTASNNTAVGYQAAYSNTTGIENTALGTGALYTNTTASSSVAVGRFALYFNNGSQNTSVGVNTMYSNTTGTNNAAVGQAALYSNTTGGNNTAIGQNALFNNTTGGQNTALGHRALETNTTGGDNVAIGRLALFVSTGTGNTVIGETSGVSMTTGSKNTILGRFSGNQGSLDIRTASNYIVLSDGDGNPRGYFNNNGTMTVTANASGDQVMYVNNTTNSNPYGIQCTFLGATPNNTTNTFFIGADSTNSKVILYSSGTINNRTGVYGTISDIKLKQDIVDASSQWDDIKAVRVRKFRLKDDVAANPDTKPLIGVIAQELEQTSAGLIDDCVDKEGDVTKSVKYSILYMKAIKALQEAMERIETLEAKVTALENK